MATKVPLTLVNGVVQQLQAGDTLQQPKVNIGGRVTATIAGGSVAASAANGSNLVLNGEGGSADNLDTITGGTLGDILVIHRGNANITLKNLTDNIALGGDRVLDDARELVVLTFNGSHWCLTGLLLL